MAENLTEICTLSVDDLYGRLPSQVFSILLRLGRSSYLTLREHTRLPPNPLRHALAALIQQRLCLWYTDDDGRTYYEASWQPAYALLQSGKIVRITEHRCGPRAADLISTILESGTCSVNDLASVYVISAGKEGVDTTKETPYTNGNVVTNGDNSMNGTREANVSSNEPTQITSFSELRQELDKLLQQGFAVPATDLNFHPAADIQNRAAAVVKEEKGKDGVKGKKATAEYEAHIITQKKRWRDESVNVEGARRSLKRRAEAEESARKQQKTKHDLDNGVNGINDHADTATRDSDKLVLRVNYEKFNVLFRNQQLVQYCERFLGSMSAQVFNYILHAVEKKVPRCFDEFDEDPVSNSKSDPDGEMSDNEDDDQHEESNKVHVTTDEIDIVLPTHLDLRSGIGHIRDKHNKDADRGRQQTEANGDADSDPDDVRVPRNKTNRAALQLNSQQETERQLLLRQHIQILHEDPRQFVYAYGSRNFGGGCVVDFHSLTKQMIQTTLEDTISARYGRESARIVRILHSKGKLEEKHIATIGFFKEHKIHALLTHMQSVGLLEIQEVPRDSHRHAGRKILLWYYDPDKVRRLMLDNTYQAMARLLQRARHEKGMIKDVIAKAERTDVKGKEDQFLSVHERRALQRWTEVEQMLLVQLARQDDLVALLRDFVPVAAV